MSAWTAACEAPWLQTGAHRPSSWGREEAGRRFDAWRSDLRVPREDGESRIRNQELRMRGRIHTQQVMRWRTFLILNSRFLIRPRYRPTGCGCAAAGAGALVVAVLVAPVLVAAAAGLAAGCAPPLRCMSTLPRKCAPSAIATRGDTMSPSTDPLSRIATLSVAVTLPVTSPSTMTAFANTCALMRPFAPIVST